MLLQTCKMLHVQAVWESHVGCAIFEDESLFAQPTGGGRASIITSSYVCLCIDIPRLKPVFPERMVMLKIVLLLHVAEKIRLFYCYNSNKNK